MRFLANLAVVLIRPRATMARILEAPGARAVLLLFALSSISGIFGDVDAPTVQQITQQTGGAWVAWMIAGVIVCVLALLVVLCWFYAYVPLFIGRFLGGTGEIRGVRAALAWGLAPTIWALLYRLPLAFWFAPSSSAVRMRGGNVAFDPGKLADGCGVALVLVLIELAVFAWCAYVMSNTVAEAHRFSAWHAFGTLVLSAIAPLVVGLAAFLSMM